MTFRKFVEWCNHRAVDGCWGMTTAITCISIINEIYKEKFWRREKVWKEKYEADVLNEIVHPIEEKIKERGMEDSL